MTRSSIAGHGLIVKEGSTCRGLSLLQKDGDPSLGTVVMVHGSLDRAGSFSRVARRIDGPRIVAYNRRGYQSSRHLGSASSLSEHIEDLADVVREVREEGPVTLVGHSFGGTTVIAAAIAEPRLADAVIVYEPPMPWLSSTAHPHRGIRPEGDPAREVERFFRHMVSDGAWDRLSPEERADREADGPALVADMTVIRMETPFELNDVAGIDIPLTIGIGSSATAHIETARKVTAAVSAGRLHEIPGAGHGAHLSHPDSFAEMIEAHRAAQNGAEQ